jgi:hypothetical protein
MRLEEWISLAESSSEEASERKKTKKEEKCNGFGQLEMTRV